MHKTYQDRNILLKELGYSSYSEYLLSDLWKKIKAEVVLRTSNKCMLCESEAHHLHHFGYSKDTLLGTNTKAIVPLCKGCHYVVEFYKDGKKRSLMESQKQYARILRAKRRSLSDRWNRCQRCRKIASKNSSYCRRCQKTVDVQIPF